MRAWMVVLFTVPPLSVSVSEELKLVPFVDSSTPVGAVTVMFPVRLTPLTLKFCDPDAVPADVVPRFSEEARQANQAMVEALNAIARTRKVTAAQIALAWLLSRKPWIVPIPGTTRLHRLEENTGAASVALSPEDLRRIQAALDDIRIVGDRYPARLAARVGR